MATTYSEFQEQAASEKVGLVQLDASKRLVGWVLDSGSLYKLSNFDHAVIVSIKDSGTSYMEVGSKAAVVPGSYFHDRTAMALYLEASDSSNPNSRFLALTFRLFFSTVPFIGPNDLSTGFDVEWEPFLKNISPYKVQIDNQPRQMGISIESYGSVSMHNDKDYWLERFDKFTFENNSIFVYSGSRELPVTEFKLLFKGRIQEKAYQMNEVTFKVKDFLNALRSKLSLDNLGDISGAKIPLNFTGAKQRRIWGFVNGVRPQNIDQADRTTGYVITGTISGSAGDLDRITGVGTLFRKELRPNDRVYIEDLGISKTVKTIVSDTALDVTEDFTSAQAAFSGSAFSVIPALPKPYINREWQLAGHALREPTASVLGIAAPGLARVDSVTDFEAGDQIAIGSILGTIQSVVGTDKLRLSGDAANSIAVGASIVRYPVTNVRINDDALSFSRDYSVDSNSGSITLVEYAETNIAPARALNGTIDITASVDTVSGTGTSFTSQLDLNSTIITSQGNFRVMEIISDTSLRFEQIPSSTSVGETVTFKKPSNFQEGSDALSCDTIGATEDGTTSGTFLKTAPQIAKDILTLAGLGGDIDTATFTTAESLAPQKVGLIEPETYSGRTTRSHRDLINEVNRSVFGVVISNPDFQLKYEVLRPERAAGLTKFDDTDILAFSVKADSKQIHKAVELTYNQKEYDYETTNNGQSTVTAVSQIGEYLAASDRTFAIDSRLINETDAQIFAQRWALMLEIARIEIEFDTKMRAARLSAAEKVDFFSSLLFERFAANIKRRIAQVKESARSTISAKTTVEDLGGGLARCGVWAASGSPSFSSAADEDKLFSGYWTDEYGMIDNDADTFGVNLWW